jgi:hypothetical protein
MIKLLHRKLFQRRRPARTVGVPYYYYLNRVKVIPDWPELDSFFPECHASKLPDWSSFGLADRNGGLETNLDTYLATQAPSAVG